MKKRLRKPESEKKYRRFKEETNFTNPFVEIPQKILHSFTHWILIDNLFGYDLLAQTHHLLIPKRVFAEETGMTQEERAELTHIKKNYGGTYDMYIENCSSIRSVYDHFHIHCISLYEETNPAYFD